jgi:hypothetical protein
MKYDVTKGGASSEYSEGIAYTHNLRQFTSLEVDQMRFSLKFCEATIKIRAFSPEFPEKRISPTKIERDADNHEIFRSAIVLVLY